MEKIVKNNYPDDAKPFLSKRFNRYPDYIIGSPYDPYMQRWWVIPRNKIFNIYLHKISADDDDSACHDHPWCNISIPLKGKILEHRYGKKSRYMKPFRIYFRRPKSAHMLEIGRKMNTEPNGKYAWTLFITGPKVREWGFLCPNGWVHWEVFTGNNKGQVGQGCGED